ncbi:MAG: hypothetical protein GKR93_08185 [Gammaproteobacteria bacterium]|nr:hypothetical protein [Gammaproteobacteria bacterium]
MANQSEWERLDKEIDSLYEKYTTEGAKPDMFYVHLLKHASKRLRLQYFHERDILNYVGAAFIEINPGSN